MPKHTQGPWKHDDTWGLILGADGSEVAACHAGRTGQRPETEANAALIAAAPELLEALRVAESLILSVRAESDDSCELADAHGVISRAIAKAEGKE